MNKSIGICKYQLSNYLKSLIGYYITTLIFYLFIALMYRDSGVSSSGLEMITVVVLFVLIIEFFKPSFYFAQGNNVSREKYLIGTVMAGTIVSAITALLDIIINRIYNNFIPAPMNFDMIYGSYRNFGFEILDYVPDNSVINLVATFLWTFLAYLFIFLIGLLIAVIYFRLTKSGKLILGGIVVGIFFIKNIIAVNLFEFTNSINILIQKSFGWHERNPYIAIITFVVLNITVILIQYFVLRKAVSNKR